MRKAFFSIAVFLIFADLVFAYSASNESFVSAGGAISSNAYSSFASLANGMAASFESFSAVTDSAPPSIVYIEFDGRSIINGDYVRPNAVITAKLTDNLFGLSAANSSIELDSSFINFTNTVKGASFSNNILTYTANFADGNHTIKLHAYDLAGNYISSEAISFKVRSGAAQVSGMVLNYKNPFSPAKGESTNITYILNNNADVTIYIYNLVGQIIKKIACASGTQGGLSGYNEVPWNGYSDFGEMAGNDVYLARLVSGGKVIGKCKIAVLK